MLDNPHRDLILATLNSFTELQKNLENRRQGETRRERIDRQRIWDKQLASEFFLRPDATRRQRRANAAYQARQAQVTEDHKKAAAFSEVAAALLKGLIPSWGESQVHALLSKLAAPGCDLPKFIDRVSGRLADEFLESKSAVSSEAPQVNTTAEMRPRNREAVKSLSAEQISTTPWKEHGAKLLKSARKLRAHRQKEAAHECGAPLETYRRWETGRQRPAERNLPRIIKYIEPSENAAG